MSAPVFLTIEFPTSYSTRMTRRPPRITPIRSKSSAVQKSPDTPNAVSSFKPPEVTLWRFGVSELLNWIPLFAKSVRRPPQSPSRKPREDRSPPKSRIGMMPLCNSLILGCCDSSPDFESASWLNASVGKTKSANAKHAVLIDLYKVRISPVSP